MNRLLYKLGLGVLVFGSCIQVAYAEPKGWTNLSEVTDLVVTSNGGVNVKLSPVLSGCTSQSGYGGAYASIYPSHPGIELMQSNLLSAMMSGKKVKLYLSDDKCTVVEMRVTSGQT